MSAEILKSSNTMEAKVVSIINIPIYFSDNFRDIAERIIDVTNLHNINLHNIDAVEFNFKNDIRVTFFPYYDKLSLYKRDYGFNPNLAIGSNFIKTDAKIDLADKVNLFDYFDFGEINIYLK